MKRMKKAIVFAIALLITGSSLFAQGEDFRFTVKTNPLNALGGPFWMIIVPLSGEYMGLFEVKTMEKQSLQLGLSYIGPSLLLNLDDLVDDPNEVGGIKTSGFKGQIMNKFFLSRDLSSPAGFYVAPHFSYASIKIKDKSDDSNFIKGSKMNINAVLGYQLITSGGFALDVYTGLGFVDRKWSVSDPDEVFDLSDINQNSGVTVPLGLSFGFAF